MKRRLGLSQNPRQHLRPVGQKRLHGPIPFRLVAPPAGKRQVRHPIRSAPALGVNVLDFERHVFLPAVGAPTPPLFEQVFAQLVTEERPMLVLDALDVGGLQGLGVEADEFQTDPGHRHPAPEPSHPGGYRLHPMAQTRRQPT
jgi:hypothetical protein